MLPKDNRTTKELFQKILKDGRAISGNIFLFKYIPGPLKISFVAPKSMAKTAVRRNSLRRKGYNAFRALVPTVKVSGVFFYRKEAKSPTTEDIKADIESILKKVR
jgi:RNase P protein component